MFHVAKFGAGCHLLSISACCKHRRRGILNLGGRRFSARMTKEIKECIHIDCCFLCSTNIFMKILFTRHQVLHAPQIKKLWLLQLVIVSVNARSSPKLNLHGQLCVYIVLIAIKKTLCHNCECKKFPSTKCLL